MRNIKVITWYAEDDVDCTGDYYSISLVDVDTGNEIQVYGDSYHDKGKEKIEGFLDGLKYCGQSLYLTEEKKNLDWS